MAAVVNWQIPVFHVFPFFAPCIAIFSTMRYPSATSSTIISSDVLSCYNYGITIIERMLTDDTFELSSLIYSLKLNIGQTQFLG